MLKLYKYDLPFKTALITGSASYHSRTGFILRYTDERADIVTEIAPLPGFSKETDDDIIKQIKEHHDKISQFLSGPFELDVLNSFINEITTSPSLQYGLSWLGATLLYTVNPDISNPYWDHEPHSNVMVNDVLGLLDPAELKEKLREAAQSGFQTIKIKCSQPDSNTAGIIRSIRTEYPGLKIRLDANQSWDQTSAEIFNKYYQDLAVEYIEEPFPEAVQSLSEPFAAPVARDESIQNLNELSEFLNSQPENYVIIKPMLFGTIFNLAETILNGRSMNRNIVITNLIESAVGRSFNLRVASLFGDPGIAHGLNTGKLLKTDLMPDHQVNNGLSESIQAVFQPIEFNQLNKELLKEIELPHAK